MYVTLKGHHLLLSYKNGQIAITIKGHYHNSSGYVIVKGHCLTDRSTLK